MIYIADSEWNPALPNPFTENGTYGEDWSSFIYVDSISSFSNVYPGTKVYVLCFSPAADIEYLRLFDFLRYELSYRRNVIVKFGGGMNAGEILNRFEQADSVVTWRTADGEVLVHSTTLPAWEQIQRDGGLYSPNLLKKNGKAICEIGLAPMLEPKDYSDYMMLDMPDGCGELVVNSRNLGTVCTDPNVMLYSGGSVVF